jgi:hypothetical protein
MRGSSGAGEETTGRARTSSMVSVRGAASAPVSPAGRASAGAGSGGAASDSAGSAPLATARPTPISAAHQGCASVRSEPPSGAIIGRRPYPIAGAHRPATGAHRRMVTVHPRQSLGGIGDTPAPRIGNRCPYGSIFGVAVCTHRGCSCGRRRAVIGGAPSGRPPRSYAFIGGWRRAKRAL